MRKRFCLLWLALLLFPVKSGAAGFSAQMLVKDGDRVMLGKLYVQDGKMRQEFTDERGQTITVVRPDKKVVWVIIPQKRVYMEMPLKTRLPGQFIQMPIGALQKRQVGKERLGGYETDKWEVAVPGGGGLEKQTIWVAPRLGTPIKMECRERNFSLEYKGIREGEAATRLFEVPPGCQKLATTEGFGQRLAD